MAARSVEGGRLCVGSGWFECTIFLISVSCAHHFLRCRATCKHFRCIQIAPHRNWHRRGCSTMCRKARHAPHIVSRDWHRMERVLIESSCCVEAIVLSKPARHENWKWGCTKQRKSRIAHNMLTRNLPSFAVACTHLGPQLQRCSKRQRIRVRRQSQTASAFANQSRSSNGLSKVQLHHSW